MKENKLIAKFMGAKPLVLGGSTEYEMYGVLDCIEDGVNEKHYFINDEMRFHVSWDWLMPVVKKCFQTGDDTHQWDDIIDTIFTCDINIVYAQVVEFIKEYNKEYNATPKFDREIYNIILVHVARTWERFRVVQNHQEMPLDNIQSAEELPNIAQKILENKVVQEFLINKDGSVWDKFGDGCSDTFIERISREYIIANYFFTIKNT